MTKTFDRSFMGYFAGAGLSSTLFPGVLWAKLAAGAEITVETIASAEEVAGVSFDPVERELMLDGLKQLEQRPAFGSAARSGTTASLMTS